MKIKEILIVIAIIVVLVIVGIVIYQPKEDEFRGNPTAEFTFIDRTQNTASISWTADDNVIAYSGDITATLSVGAVVSFDPVSSISDTGISADLFYYITVASISGFEISEARGGTTVDILDDSTHENKVVFYEEINPRYYNVADTRHITISFMADDDASVSLKLVGSIADDVPDWYASQSIDNRYDYIGMYDLEDAALIPGDTGLTYAAANDHRIFTVNTDELAWVAFRSERYASGSLDIRAKSSD